MHINEKFNENWHQHHFGAQTNKGLIIIILKLSHLLKLMSTPNNPSSVSGKLMWGHTNFIFRLEIMEFQDPEPPPQVFLETSN